MPKPIHQLVYRSVFRAARVVSPLQALRDIVAVSIRNNARDDITGYLIFDGETFLQILEGGSEAVEATFARISRDARHRDPQLLLAGAAAERAFSKWAMNGYLRREADAQIFARHGVPGAIPDVISGQSVLALARELAAEQGPAGSEATVAGPR